MDHELKRFTYILDSLPTLINADVHCIMSANYITMNAKYHLLNFSIAHQFSQRLAAKLNGRQCSRMYSNFVYLLCRRAKNWSDAKMLYYNMPDFCPCRKGGCCVHGWISWFRLNLVNCHVLQRSVLCQSILPLNSGSMLGNISNTSGLHW